MDTLSLELMSLIVNEVDKSDLPNLCLVSQSLSVPATQRLFSQIHVTLKEESQAKYHCLLDSSHRRLVNRIHITTSNEPYREKNDYRMDGEEADFTEEIEECFLSISRLPNLCEVVVEFSDACMVDDDPDNAWTNYVEESVLYRYEILDALFATLNDPKLPTSRLSSLTLKNLQNYNDERVVKSPNFIEVLSRLSELRLKIVTEYDSSSPENNWNKTQMHTFFVELSSIWLKSTVQNLSSLCIHSDVLWGYVPLCDFRTLHFAKLKKLELGNYSFSHDWQLDWILSHKTLEIFILDDCNIVNYIYGYGLMDEERYPSTPTVAWGDHHMWKYDAQWSQYFDAIRISLPNLRKFRFGSGNWDEGKNFDSEEGFTLGAHQEAYMAFNRGIGPAPWEPVGEFIKDSDTLSGNWTIETRNRLVGSRVEDERAFGDLMDAVEARV